MKKRNHVISLLCILLICFSLTISVSAAQEPVSAEDVSTNQADKTTELPMFSLDTSEPRVFTQDSTDYVLYPASVRIDTNGDGKCTASEARTVLRISAQLVVYDGDIAELDISGNGVIDAADARIILRYSAFLDKYYLTENGSCPEGFVTDDNGNVYHFKNSVMSLGLKTIDSDLYYFQADTGMTTGLCSISNSIYCFGEDGKAVSGKLTVDGNQYFFENGKAKTGYFKDGGSYYYCNPDGTMATGFVTINGSIYYFGTDGKAANGKQTVNGKNYLFENGKAKTGLVKEGDWYYFYNSDGTMATGKMKINGTTYDFGTDGKGKVCKDPSQYKIAMIGDSLVANIGMSNVTDRIDFYGKVSLHASNIFTKSVSGSSRYIIDEVKGRGYDVVIILVGINDLGYSDSVWGEQYRDIIEGVRERCPDAIIYAHAILPVNETVARNNGYSCTNAQIRNKNSVIKRIAQEENVNYIDATAVLADANGSLPANGASDGIHFYKSYCQKWSNWLIETICK